MSENYYQKARYEHYTEPDWAPPKPPGASSTYVHDPVTNEGHWLTGIVTDKEDGITDADFEGGGFSES